LPLNARRAGAGSWLRRRLDERPRKGTTFLCGVRVLSGEIPGETQRWSFRRSAADEYVPAGVVTIQHGKTELRLHLASEHVRPGHRRYHVLIKTVEVASGAHAELSLPAGELVRFGLD